MKKTFAKNAVILCVLLTISKIIGAFYRLPLTNLLKAEGMGIYQLVFPVFSLSLTLSSSFASQALAKIVAEKRAKGDNDGAYQVFVCAEICIITLSLILALSIIILAPTISKLQGQENAKVCYYALAPAVVFVGIITVYRGLFQGENNMFPSGISAVVEQGFKAIFGLTFAYILSKKGIIYGAMGAFLGITFSEIVASLYLFLAYLFKKEKFCGGPICFKKNSILFLSVCFPIATSLMIMPFVQFIDSALIVNLLTPKNDLTVATAQFGLSSGVVSSLVNLPVVLSLSIATAVLPKVSAYKSQKDLIATKTVISKSATLNFLLSAPCAVGLAILSYEIVSFLYSSGLSESEMVLTSKLLKVGSLSVVFLSFTEVFSSILQGLGKLKIPIIALAVGGAVKIILNIILIPRIGIVGDQIANVCCYFSSMAICLISVIKFLDKTAFVSCLKILLACALMTISVQLFQTLKIGGVTGLILTIFVAIIIYFGVISVLFLPKLLKNKTITKSIAKN